MATAELTGRRRQIFDYVVSATKERGYPPTMREIATALNYKSPSTVLHHLRKLEQMGYIERDADRNRALRPAQEHLPATQRTRQVPLVGRVAAGTPITAA